jgi:hypothetical protein
MAGLALIERNFRKWDMKRHSDYKVQHVVFVCDQSQYTEWPGYSLTAWKFNEKVYGIATCDPRVRVYTCHLHMPGATLYRVGKRERQSLMHLGGEPIHKGEKQYMKECFKLYVDELYKN